MAVLATAALAADGQTPAPTANKRPAAAVAPASAAVAKPAAKAAPKPVATAAAAPVAKAAAKKQAARPKLSDSQLEAAIRAKFAKSKIHEDKFTVSVQGGVAHIDGKTNVMQHKGVATRMSKTAGASVVDNRVQISDAAKAKAMGNLEQGRRRVQVKRGDSPTAAISPR